jgi:hypothetical protein
VKLQKSQQDIKSVFVNFDTTNETYKIEKRKATYEKTKGITTTRTQFPLCVAYALTIHKCQGLSLDVAMMDLGSDIFEDGMAYVALSRVRSFENVHIIALDATKIKCSSICVEEYNRLVNKAGQGLTIKQWNKNPFFAKSKTLSISAKDIIEQLNAKSTATTVAKLPKNVSQVAAHYGVLFENSDAKYCYANSLVQCLLSASGLANEVKLFTENSVCTELHRLFQISGLQKSVVSTTQSLRAKAAGEFAQKRSVIQLNSLNV